VRFTGWTSELPELLSLSHFTLLPSVHEAFGIVLLEGMTAGTPVVATAGEGGAEVIEEHGTGFLYNRNEEVDALAGRMHALWQNRKAYEALSARCRSVALNDFSLESFGKRLVRFYEDALRGPAA
jgi:glycosyltransferase involved in cell wall biosynthesis